MYTNEDLNYAIDKGIFSKESVDEFRTKLENSKKTNFVDEESFKLISSFNDIFIVIACLLLLFSTLWAVRNINEHLATFVFIIISWGLAEVFVLKRKMALPAIVLLLSFVGGVFVFCFNLYGDVSESSFIVAAAVAAIAAYIHWRRFGVPITIAALTTALVTLVASVVMLIYPNVKDYLLSILFICGIIIFVFAMYWDSSDKERITNKSDVAFWLHLLSAPLIIHSIFSGLGIFDSNETASNMIIVIGIYFFMSLISITVDRRAFMVSSLAYVIYAISNILEEIGGISYSLALTGIFIGGSLLILSAYWHIVRVKLIHKLPTVIQKYVPTIR